MTWVVAALEGTVAVGGLVAVGLYLAPLYTPLQRFSELNVVFANSMAALERIFEILDQKPEITDRADAVKLQDIRGKVEFDHVHFSYSKQGEGTLVLADLDFSAESGAKIALVGPSDGRLAAKINEATQRVEMMKSQFIPRVGSKDPRLWAI